MAGMLMKLACVVVACMVVLAPHAEAITCGQVAGSLIYCLTYLRSGGLVPASCCSGVKGLNSNARTTADRRAVCGCLKQASGSYPGINPTNAASLPGRCGVKIPYKISQNTDCSKVQ